MMPHPTGRFGVTKEAYPSYKLFLKGSEEATDYVQGTPDTTIAKASDLGHWIKQTAGVYLTAPGALVQFDVMAIKFVSQPGDREAIRAEASELAAELPTKDQETGKYYALVMKKIIEKGDTFPVTEIARLNKLLQGGSLTKAKADLFKTRLNILPSFKSLVEKEL